MKRVMGITFLTLLLSVLSSVAFAQEIYPANGHQYAVVSAPRMSWDSARSDAATRQLGGPSCSGYLATVTSKGEDDFIRNKFGTTAILTKWLGGIQKTAAEVGTGWEWITGEPWVYTGWNAGEPNNRYYTDVGYEDALSYYTPGGWNDAPRGWTSYDNGGYIVEYDCFQVALDIKPGSDPNCFNINGNGVIPIAILGSADLDVTHIDPLSLRFQGMAVRVRGNGGPQCSVQKVNGDLFDDLVCQFVDDPSQWISGQTSAEVTGVLRTNGAGFKGADSICVVNQNLNP